MSYRPVDPKQSFPALEDKVLERWKRASVFKESLTRREGSPRYVFYEGPPTANGRPGSHHVLARVFKDVFPRYKTMQGYYVHRKGGWDCHGLPVELEVEKRLGLNGKDDIERYGVEEFNTQCRDSVLTYVDEWNQLTERIGFWLDTDDAYLTMSNEYIESVWWTLKEIDVKKLLYQGHKVVPYCPRCGTALSSHELQQGYQEITDPSVFVRFPMKSNPSVSFLGWTTTPWTLLSNAALAVHPNMEYAKVSWQGEEVVLARSRVEIVLGSDAEVLDTFRGKDLAGQAYLPPFDYVTDFGNRGHTILEADFVTDDTGTGIVHTALAFGEDDFRLGQQYGLTLQNPVKEDGTFEDRMGQYAGKDVRSCNDAIVTYLREKNLLFRKQNFKHSYPHCWRCSTPLLYYAKSSWYARTTAVKERMVEENRTVDWHPDHVQEGRFGQWLENNVDWALSRDRYWGTPLPIWTCSNEHVHCVGSVDELKALGADPPEDLHKPYIDTVTFPCPECSEKMHRVPEVLDVWWDSGAMPFAQWHYPMEHEEDFADLYPADYICEALDQTRGWFYSLLAISTMIRGISPYRTVLCLGLILDEQGKKMSKTQGNVIEPWSVLNEFGADAFRWYYLTSKQPWDGYLFSETAVRDSVRLFLLQLWNTYAFMVLYANANSVTASDVSNVELEELDRWILSRLQSTVSETTDRLDAYDATGAGRVLTEFLDRLSNWYLRRSRKRFWEGDPAAFATLNHVLVTFCKLLAPFCPFVADEIYLNLDGAEKSVHLCDFPMADPALENPALEEAMELVREVVELGRTARANAQVKNRQPLATAIVAAENGQSALTAFKNLLQEELNVKEVVFSENASELGTWEVKPNFRTLGKRFQGAMKDVQSAINALDGNQVAAQLEEGMPVTIEVDGVTYQLGNDDLLLKLQPLAGYATVTQDVLGVALDLNLTNALQAEGLAREIVRSVQDTRKNIGLNVDDRIFLTLSGDAALIAAAKECAQTIRDETQADALTLEGECDQVITVADRELKLRIEKA